MLAYSVFFGAVLVLPIKQRTVVAPYREGSDFYWGARHGHQSCSVMGAAFTGASVMRRRIVSRCLRVAAARAAALAASATSALAARAASAAA